MTSRPRPEVQRAVGAPAPFAYSGACAATSSMSAAGKITVNHPGSDDIILPP